MDKCGFTLRVVFHGMCTFVPDCQYRRMWVFLSRGSRDEHVAKGISLHGAFIRFSAKHLLGVDSPPGNVLWRLNGHHVEISDISDSPLEVACFDWETCRCPSDIEKRPRECFGWVAPVEDACAARDFPGGGEIDQRFLESRLPAADKEFVGARFLIEKGSVASGDLMGFEDKLFLSRFRPVEGGLQDGDLRQYTAATVIWSVRVLNDFVTFRTLDLERGDEIASVKLRPPKGRNSVQVEVLNEEAELLTGLRAGSPVIFGSPRLQDRVFESVYLLCKNPPGPEARPIPVFERLEPSPFGSMPYDSGIVVDGSPPCSPNGLILIRS